MVYYGMIWWMRLYAMVCDSDVLVWDFNATICDSNDMVWDFSAMICYDACCNKRYA